MVRTIGTSSVVVCLVALLMIHDSLGQERSSPKSKTADAAKSTRATAVAQSPSNKDSGSSTTAATKPGATDIDDSPKKRSRRRLPRYFGQLDLDNKQREDVYSIQASYQQQLEDLTMRLAELKSERDAKIREVLNPAQQHELSSLGNARAKTKPTSKPKTVREVTKSQPTG